MVAGIVLVRQRPGTAKGVVFLTLEDESGVGNVVVWKKVMERFRPEIMGARLLKVKGRIEREGDIVHLVAHRMDDCSDQLLLLSESPDMLDVPICKADEIKYGSADPIEGDLHPSRLRAGRLSKHRPVRHPRNVRDLVPKSRDFH
ncbi:hypothetical protein JCM17843_31080 [Kordiimonadales bacterium JCM 17843]|nr:hypothetical protein JCM17843_31080 [Kordiimonadales bacterium JCM 17843]